MLPSMQIIARGGKAVYGVNCAACHGADLRGGDQGGPSLLRSLVALSEFGRRVAENGSGGADHATAGSEAPPTVKF